MSLISGRTLGVGALAATAWLWVGCGGDDHHGGTTAAQGADGAAGGAALDAGKDAASDAQTMHPLPMGMDGGEAGHGGATGGAGGAGGSGGASGGGGGGHPSTGCDKSKCAAMSDDCNVAACDKKTNQCKLTPRADGIACGSDKRDTCTVPDTCKAGVCLTHDAPKGTPCGDQNKECHVDDACDGKGKCKDHGLLPEGSACGDQTTNTECDKSDTCSAAGVCSKNWAPADSACGDQDTPCRYDDTCDGVGNCTDHGLWTLGACPLDVSKEEADGCLCGNDILNVCQYAVDVCIDGTCVLGREPDGMACGDTGTNTQCDKPDSCAAGFCSQQLRNRWHGLRQQLGHYMQPCGHLRRFRQLRPPICGRDHLLRAARTSANSNRCATAPAAAPRATSRRPALSAAAKSTRHATIPTPATARARARVTSRSPAAHVVTRASFAATTIPATDQARASTTASSRPAHSAEPSPVTTASSQTCSSELSATIR